jgi:hypothetical protein
MRKRSSVRSCEACPEQTLPALHAVRGASLPLRTPPRHDTDVSAIVEDARPAVHVPVYGAREPFAVATARHALPLRARRRHLLVVQQGRYPARAHPVCVQLEDAAHNGGFGLVDLNLPRGAVPRRRVAVCPATCGAPCERPTSRPRRVRAGRSLMPVLVQLGPAMPPADYRPLVESPVALRAASRLGRRRKRLLVHRRGVGYPAQAARPGGLAVLIRRPGGPHSHSWSW